MEEDSNIIRGNKKAKTVKDPLLHTSNYKHSQYMDQNTEFCDYMEDCAISIDNFNKESNLHLYYIFDGHGGTLLPNYVQKNILKFLENV